jgi:hypothetical protein
MSTTSKETTLEYCVPDGESSTFEHEEIGLVIHPIEESEAFEESEDFAALVNRLTKSNWFCEVADA